MGKIEMLPILQISPRPFQMIADTYDFKFSLVGKIWDGWETVTNSNRNNPKPSGIFPTYEKQALQYLH